MNIIESVQKNKLVKELSNGLKEIKILDKTNNILLTHYFEDKNDNYTKFFKQYNFIGEPISKVEYEKLNENQMLILSFILALFYAFARTIWEQANYIEVYSLQLLLINLILYSIIKAVIDKENSRKYFVLTAFFLGLGFSNHLTTILLFPAILFLYFKPPGEKFILNSERWKFLAFLIIPFAVGLSFYIYLPLRSASLPEFNWGWVHRGLEKFMYHVQGKQYQVWMFSDPDLWKGNLGKFINTLPIQFIWIGIVFFLYGFYRAVKSSKAIFWFLIILIISCLLYTLNYSIHDIESYFSTAFIGLFIFAGAGILGIVEKKPKIIPAFFLLPIIALIVNYSQNDRSGDYSVSEYTKILMNNLQPNAVIISAQWDYWCSPFWYMQRVEGYRNDIVLIEKELLRRTWYPKQLMLWHPEVIGKCKAEIDIYMQDLEIFESGEKYDPASIQQKFINMLNCFIDKNYGKRPVYLTLDVMQSDPDIGKVYEKIPEGFAFRLEREKKIYPVSVEKIEVNKLIESVKEREGHLEEGIISAAALNLANIGRYAMFTEQRQEAIKAFKLALEVEPKNEVALQGLRQLSE